MKTRDRIVILTLTLALASGACGDDENGAEGTDREAVELATHKVDVVAKFDAAARQQTEGVAVDDDGNVFVSWSGLGEVVKFAEGATKPEPFGKVTLSEGDFGVLGLAADSEGNVYGAVQSRSANGLWRFDAETGDATRVEGSEAMGFPNDVAVTPGGDVYVASSVEGKDAAGANQGGIWKVADGKATKWLVNADLGGTGATGLPSPIGANGIEYHDGSLYVTNTEKGRVTIIPIDDEGAPGTMRVLAEGQQLAAADGLDIDPAGNAFVAVIGQQKIVRVSSDGAITEIAGDADGLDYPSSVQFGVDDKADTLYVVNFAIGELLGAKTVEGPALLSIPPAA